MSDFEIQYAAHTATCTFLLDSEGICRRIVMVPSAGGRTRDAAKTASRCVGAQYVASLDPSLSGMLSEMPKVGISMLFARTDERGRISLVRTGHVERFERYVEDPFIERERPSVVATSAPPISPSVMPTQRLPRATIPPDAYDAALMDDRTMPVRPSDFRALRHAAGSPHDHEPPTVRAPFAGEHVPRTRSEVVPRPNAEPIRPAIRRRA